MSITSVTSGQSLSGAVTGANFIQVMSGGTVVATTVSSDGYLEVSSGGVASNTVVGSEGFDILLGGIETGATIQSGGALVVQEGQEIAPVITAGAVVIVSSGGTLVAPTIQSGTRVSVYAGGQVSSAQLAAGAALNFLDLPYTSGETASLDSGNDVLTVTNGGTVVTSLQLAGSYAADTFTVASTFPITPPIGTNGTTITVVSSGATSSGALVSGTVVVNAPGSNTVNVALGSNVSFGGGVSVSATASGPSVTLLGKQGPLVVNGATVSGTLVGPVIVNPAGTPLFVNGFAVSARGTTFLDGNAAIATSTPLQTQLVQAIIGVQLAGSSRAEVVPPGGASTLSGSAAMPMADIVLDNPGASYTTGASAASIVAVGDGAPSTIINNGAGDALIAVTGAATNTLEGLAGANQFVTGTGGQDAVLLYGAANSLTTSGADAVLVGGPSTITAAAAGLDLVAMTAGTTLTFVNLTSGPAADSITGAAGGTVILAGPGNASLTAAAGAEGFVVDTSAGNITLNGAPGGGDTFLFVKDASNASANVAVNAFAGNDTLAVHGYAGFSVQAGAGGAVLALSDGSQVTFGGASVATIQQAVKIV